METGLPKQRIALSQKTEEWKKATIDYYITMSYTTTTGNRTSNYNKLINYDLFNGKFNKADLEYVCNPLGLKDNEFPATLQHYDVISKPIELLISDEANRPDNQMVISEAPSDLNRKQEQLKGKITALLQQQLMAAIDPSTIDPNNPPPTPEQILKHEKYTPSDIIESKANRILKNIKRKLVTKELFKKGWKDALIAGEEIYWVGIANGEPVLRRCNPVNTTVVLDADSDFIDDATAIIETRLLSPSTILDEFGDILTPDQVRQVEMMNKQYSSTYATAHGPNPTFTLTNNGVIDTNLAPTFSQYGSSAGAYNQHLIRVSRIEWKSMKKMYYITYTDENDLSIETIVDEGFKKNIVKEVYPDLTVEEFWITEAWEGIKIGTDLYIGVQAKPNQRRRIDNPYSCKLGYTGYIYNATNSQSVSLIDRLKPYQYLYNILMYRLELAFASDQGKIFLMDLAQIPRSEGIDIEKWMYYLKAMKIGFINSFEEGRKGQATGRFSQFNQFQSIDLSLANTIQQYIQSLEYIHQQVYFISGVSPQRLGSIQSKELVGNVERSIEQSSLITEHYFDLHDEVKRRTYTSLIEAAKIAYRNGKQAQYILDDMGIEMLNIEEFELENSEFGVYMSNSKKDQIIHETLKQNLQIALQTEKVDLSTMVESLINDSNRDIIRLIQTKEQEFYQRKAEEQQLQKELQDQNLAHQAELEQFKMDLERDKLDAQIYIADSNNQTKLQVAEISNYFKAADTDTDNDGVPDPIEIANHALEQSRLQSDIIKNQISEGNKLKVEADKNALKEKEIQAKKAIEDKKAATKEKELKMQQKIEELKARTAIRVAKSRPKNTGK
jgi:hypothetical protein